MVINEKLFSFLIKGKIPYLIITLVVAVTFIKLPSFNFSGFDDKIIILGNIDLLKNFDRINEAFNTDAFIRGYNSPFYRPLQTVTFFIDAQISENKPVMYHISNVIIHILTSLLMFVFLKKMNINEYLSFFGALMFGINPLLVHSVAWIPARGDLLVSMFIVLSFIFWINFLNSYENKYLILSSVFIFLGALSKEVALVTPVLLALYYLLYKKEDKDYRIFIRPGFYWLILTAFYFILRNGAIKSEVPDRLYSMDNLFQNLPTIFEFISKFIFGFQLSPMADFSFFVTFTGFIILAATAVYFYFFRGFDFKIVIIGITWIIIFLVPTLFYNHNLGDFAYKYLEHRAYLPIFGFVLILSSLIENWIQNDNKNIKKILLLLVLLIYGIHSFAYSETYRNSYNLYTRAIEMNPKSAMAYYNRGVNMRNENPEYHYVEDLNRAIELNPNYLEALYDRGNYYSGIGDNQKAVKDYLAALKINQNHQPSLNNLGIVYGKLKENEKAVDAFNKALILDPNSPETYSNRGFAFTQLNRFQEAINDFNTAIKINPNFSDAYNNRGNARFQIKDYSGACDDWLISAKLGNKNALKNINEFCNKR